MRSSPASRRTDQVSDLAGILFNARRAEGFRAFLAARGCEAMAMLNAARDEALKEIG